MRPSMVRKTSMNMLHMAGSDDGTQPDFLEREIWEPKDLVSERRALSIPKLVWIGLWSVISSISSAAQSLFSPLTQRLFPTLVW